MGLPDRLPDHDLKALSLCADDEDGIRSGAAGRPGGGRGASATHSSLPPPPPPPPAAPAVELETLTEEKGNAGREAAVQVHGAAIIAAGVVQEWVVLDAAPAQPMQAAKSTTAPVPQAKAGCAPETAPAPAPAAVAGKGPAAAVSAVGASWELVPVSSPPAVALSSADFVHVPASGLTAVRALARRRPDIARGLLWLVFAALLAGELATTAWWLYDLGFWGCFFLSVPLAATVALALLALSPEQVLTAAVSLGIAALPALPAYSAVLLMMPLPESSSSGATCWDILHWPTLLALAIMYLASALVPALRAEFRSPTGFAARAREGLEAAQEVARSFCGLSALLYAAVALHVGAAHLLAPEGTSPYRWWGAALLSPVSHGRGFLLGLHALGFACAQARANLAAALGDEMLPLLLGARRAQALTIRALAMQHGRHLLGRVSALRRFAPPRSVVASVVALRRTAPVLFPAAALVSQLVRQDIFDRPRLALVVVLLLVALSGLVAAHEWRSLPDAPLRRLPLLLPRGLAPLSRRLIGYGLAAAEGLHGARGQLRGVRRRLRGIRGGHD